MMVLLVLGAAVQGLSSTTSTSTAVLEDRRAQDRVFLAVAAGAFVLAAVFSLASALVHRVRPPEVYGRRQGSSTPARLTRRDCVVLLAEAKQRKSGPPTSPDNV